MLVNRLSTANVKVLLLSFALKYLTVTELKGCHQNICVKKTILRAIIQDFVMELSQQTIYPQVNPDEIRMTTQKCCPLIYYYPGFIGGGANP